MARPPKITDHSVESAIRLLSCYTPKSEIKRYLSSRYKLSARSCETVLARAREAIADSAGRSLDEWRRDGVANLTAIVADKKTSVRERILAQAELNKLLGLNRAERIEVSGPAGGPIQTEQRAFDPKNCTPEQLATLRAVLAARSKP